MAVGTDDPSNQKLYASTSSSVYKSTNGGISWSEADGLHDGTPNQILPGGGKRAFLLAPSVGGEFGPARAVVGTEGGVWGTIDDGARWKPLSKSVPTPPMTPTDTMDRHVWSLAIGLGGPNGLNLMAGTAGFGVYALPLDETGRTQRPTPTRRAVAPADRHELHRTNRTCGRDGTFFYSYHEVLGVEREEHLHGVGRQRDGAHVHAQGLGT